MPIRFWLFLIVWAPVSFAADGSDLAVTPALIESRLETIEAGTDLGEETKSELTGLYRRALTDIETRDAHLGAAAEFAQARNSATAAAAKLRKSTAERQDKEVPIGTSIRESTTLAEIESLVQKAKADLEADSTRSGDYADRLETEAGRADVIRLRLSEIARLQTELVDLPAAIIDDPGGRALAEAGQWRIDTQRASLRAEIKMLNAELLSQPMRIALLQAKLDDVAQSVTVNKKTVQKLTEILNEKRATAAEIAKYDTEAAMAEAASKGPVIRGVAERNAQLSTELETIARALESVKRDITNYRANLDQITDQFKYAREKLSVAGVNQVLGHVLAAQRRDLDTLKVSPREARARERIMADVGLRAVRHREERRAGRQREKYVADLTVDLKKPERAAIAGELAAIVQARMGLLDQVINSDSAYLRALSELDFLYRQLRESVSEYGSFLDQHLIWIRSTPGLKPSDLTTVPSEVLRLTSPREWREVAVRLAQPTLRTFLVVATLMLYLLWRWKTPWWRALISNTGNNVGQITNDRFSNTAMALTIALLASLPGPLVLASVASQLTEAANGHPLSIAVAGALWQIFPWIFGLRFLRLIADDGGIGGVHFRWPRGGLSVLHHETGQLLQVVIPLLVLFIVAVRIDLITLGGTLPKLVFVIALLVIARSMARLFDRRDGVFAEWLSRNERKSYVRLAPIWSAAIAAVPVILSILVLIGYLYTSSVLLLEYFYTLLVIAGAILLHQLAVRWLTISARRLTRQAAIDRFETQRTARETPAGAEEGEIHGIDEPDMDIVSLSDESYKLVQVAVLFIVATAIWFIWSDIFVALSVLEKFTVWKLSDKVDGETVQVVVTLADLGMALLIGIATVVLTRNLPSLIEIILRQRLEVTNAALYTVNALITYVVVTVGLILIFSMLGGRWAQIQWLVAALGVGIGFGLQEIVANFISGLIILFERPIRVGDVVTVGDVDGVVTKIRIRATTIRNWDRKELIVPNKEFITGRLLNWSLSDPIIRIHFYVGIAYGSDVEHAMALVAEAAEENELVLSDPTPFVTFEEFGDNSLNIGIRCYVNSVDHRLSVRTDLHVAINRKLTDAGIVIAFPQRDVHLNTLAPLEVSIKRDSEE